MTLDASTLQFAEGVVTFAGGLILLINWWQDRAAWGAFWWAAANCGLGMGVALLAQRASLPNYASDIVAPVIMDVSTVLAWIAARIFNRGSIRPLPVIAAVSACGALLIFTGAYASGQLAAALGQGMAGCLYAAGAFEFWLARGERLRGRWLMISVLGSMAISLFLLAAEFSFTTLSLWIASIAWLGIIHFATLIYGVGSTVFLVMMLKDRSETKHKAAALIDPLTGLANRRAFMGRAESMLGGSLRDNIPISLLAFDLDYFKGVNDRFGHPVGDHVLRIFTSVLSRVLRPADIAGRIGGEEFLAALPGCSSEAALAIARRIRGAFQDDARFMNGKRVGATISVGVATAPEHGRSVADVIAGADGALYRAKDLGRNRVMLADANSRDLNLATVVRIA